MSAAVKPPGPPPAAVAPGEEAVAGGRSRGRPRSPQLRDAILRAARSLLDEAGPSGLTMEAVAERAGVGKPTVYRWWPNRHAVTMAALMVPDVDATGPAAQPAASARRRAPLAALERQLLAVADTLLSRHGRSVTAMIAAADPDTEIAKAFRHHFVLARRNEGRVLLEQAVVAGELRGGVNLDVALDQIYGALFFRVLLGHAPIDAPFVRVLLRQTVRGLAADAAVR
jgi:AcrR family transcriptional regulator